MEIRTASRTDQLKRDYYAHVAWLNEIKRRAFEGKATAYEVHDACDALKAAWKAWDLPITHHKAA
jgi:hypothetical protein